MARGRCSWLVVLTSHLVALGLYALATVLVLAPFTGLRPAPRGLLVGVLIAGIAAHALGVTRLTPFMGVAPTLSLLALFLALLQLASELAFRLFPPLERLDQLNHLSLVVGFPTVTLGVLLGFGVRYAGGVSVDAAQVVWGMLMWLVLGWAVGVRVVRHWAGRRAAFASIASFAAVLLVYLALKLSTPGTERFL